MKSYTDLERSKKLAEILPLESADMYYLCGDEGDPQFGTGFYEELEDGFSDGKSRPADVPCWSLAALLDVLSSSTLDSSNDHYYRLHCMERFTEWYDNPVDACYEMIIKLHEQKLL